jgi:hypothetical protein
MRLPLQHGLPLAEIGFSISPDIHNPFIASHEEEEKQN